VTRPEDLSGASCLAWPETAVAIRVAAPVATELYRRVLPVAPLDGLKRISRSSLTGQSPLPIGARIILALMGQKAVFSPVVPLRCGVLLAAGDIRFDHFGGIDDPVEFVLGHEAELECGRLQREIVVHCVVSNL
jgi:hypothetical protein